MHRVIVHVDIDCFFAAVEVRERSLHGRPVAIVQHEDIVCVNYEARALGVQKHMHPADCAVHFPDVVQVPMPVSYGNKVSYTKYRLISYHLFEMIASLCQGAVFEKASIDEAHIDLTNTPLISTGASASSQWEAAARFVSHMRERVLNQFGLAASAGISVNKLVAKLASKAAKPNGVKVVPPADVAAFIAHTRIAQLPGFGRSVPRAARERLATLALSAVESTRVREAATECSGGSGTEQSSASSSSSSSSSLLALDTCADVAGVSDNDLARALSLPVSNGAVQFLRNASGGVDFTPVTASALPKKVSVSMSLTPFSNTLPRLVDVFDKLAREIADRAAEECQIHNRLASRLTLAWREVDRAEVNIVLPYHECLQALLPHNPTSSSSGNQPISSCDNVTVSSSSTTGGTNSLTASVTHMAAPNLHGEMERQGEGEITRGYEARYVDSLLEGCLPAGTLSPSAITDGAVKHFLTLTKGRSWTLRWAAILLDNFLPKSAANSAVFTTTGISNFFAPKAPPRVSAAAAGGGVVASSSSEAALVVPTTSGHSGDSNNSARSYAMPAPSVLPPAAGMPGRCAETRATDGSNYSLSSALSSSSLSSSSSSSSSSFPVNQYTSVTPVSAQGAAAFATSLPSSSALSVPHTSVRTVTSGLRGEIVTEHTTHACVRASLALPLHKRQRLDATFDACDLAFFFDVPLQAPLFSRS